MQLYFGPGGAKPLPPRFLKASQIKLASAGGFYDAYLENANDALAKIKAEAREIARSKVPGEKERAKELKKATINTIVNIAEYRHWIQPKSFGFLRGLKDLMLLVNQEATDANKIVADLRLHIPRPSNVAPNSQLLPMWSRNTVRWQRVASHGYGDITVPALTAIAFERMWVRKIRRDYLKNCHSARYFRHLLTSNLDVNGSVSYISADTAAQKQWRWADECEIPRSMHNPLPKDTSVLDYSPLEFHTKLASNRAKVVMFKDLNNVIDGILKCEVVWGWDFDERKTSPGSLSEDVANGLQYLCRVRPHFTFI